MGLLHTNFNYGIIDIQTAEFKYGNIIVINLFNMLVKRRRTFKTYNDSWSNRRYWCSNHDYKFLNDFCKGLKKKGWKVHNLGRKPSTHTDYGKASKCKKGIWLTLDNGVDCEVFRHFANDTWFAQKLKNNKSVPVLGLMGDAGNIKKGGKYFKYLGMAHDGTGKGQPGLKYPAGYLASCGVPFFYAKNAKEAVEKFDKGGDSQKALETNFIKRKVRGGYYTNWNWGSDY